MEIFERGSLIYREGEVADKIAILHKGKVKIFKENPFTSGRKEYKVTLDLIDGGPALLGEETFDPSVPRSSAAEALEKCQISWIPTTQYLEMLVHNPKLLLNTLEFLATKRRKQIEILSWTHFLNLPQRLASLLLTLSDPENPNIKLTQLGISELLGASLARTNRNLGLMVNRRYIEQRSKLIIVKDRQNLERMALGLAPIKNNS